LVPTEPLHLNEKWQLKDWTGTLHLQDIQTVPRIATMDVEKLPAK